MPTIASTRDIVTQLIMVAIFFAFPAIWTWLVTIIPWWPLDPQSTLNILTIIVVTVVMWVLGYFGIQRVKRMYQYMMDTHFTKGG